MTTAILVVGIVAVLLVAWSMRRPDWRLAALLFALLAIPGNVDNLMPQMRLDPHDIANSTAPAVSFVDLLIVWGLALSVREDRFRDWPRDLWLIVGVSALTATLATAVTIVNVFVDGVEAPAAVRGVLTMWRLPALLALAFALRSEVRGGRPLAIAATAAVIVLIGNGLYTSAGGETTRFTAATFGRNGFSLVLVVGAIMAAGLAIDLRRREHSNPWPWALALCVAAAALFGAIATGTRMSLLVAAPAILAAMAVNRSWWNRPGIIGAGAMAVGVLVVAAAAMLWTTEGARALSGWTNPGETVDIITDPESEPDYSPVRTRTRWWDQALTLARSDPLTGIGPYQWNIRRYELEPDAEPIVADPHNTYIQTATEYGLPVLVTYIVTLISAAGTVAYRALSAASTLRSSAIATSVAAAALMTPAAEATNSYLFNVRIGPMAWLLMGVAIVLAVMPVVVNGRGKPMRADRSSVVRSHPAPPV